MNSAVCIATSKNGGRDGGFEREMEERVKREMKEGGVEGGIQVSNCYHQVLTISTK